MLASSIAPRPTPMEVMEFDYDVVEFRHGRQFLGSYSFLPSLDLAHYITAPSISLIDGLVGSNSGPIGATLALLCYPPSNLGFFPNDASSCTPPCLPLVHWRPMLHK